MRVLAFGTYQSANHPRIAVLLTGLGERGHDVVEANVPLGLSTAQRVQMLGSKSGGLRMLVTVAKAWSRLIVQGLRAKRHGGPDVVLVGYMGHFDVWLARALFPRTTIVLDHLIFAASTARDRGVGQGGIMQKVLRLIDRSALTLADIVVVDTDEHAAAVPDRLRSKAVVVPVGAPDAWFVDQTDAVDAHPAETARPLRVVFFGLYTPLQGATVIGEAIGMLSGDDVTFTMIGSGQDLEATKALSEGGAATHWRPWVDAADLPAVVATHDVGLGIFGTGEKALNVVPNKVYQCAAAGNAIVTSETTPQTRILGSSAVFVAPGDAAALADALRSLAADRSRLSAMRSNARALAEKAFRPVDVVEPLVRRLANR